MEEIENVISFIVEIEKLKNVHRKSKPVGLDRVENSAEHSWHVCLSALMLKDYANEEIDIDRVIKMLLIHDLGEIDGGDKIIYSSETKDQKDKEALGVKRILGYLPEKEQNEYMALWYEFEAGETSDSKYAKAIDRVPPLLHNIHSNGYTWKKNNITKEQVFSINGRINEGSSTLWENIKAKLEKAVADGILK
jgi:putative hydrolase of HD superfamily